MVFEIFTTSCQGQEVEYEYTDVSQEEFVDEIQTIDAVLIFSYVISGLEIKKRRA